ncbi:MAG: polya polymerase [Lachnospiraceae bacterium]
MKLMNVKNVDKLFAVIDSCKGKVELVTGEGDRLNLKSKLSQYVSLTQLFSDRTIPEMELVAYEPEDTKKLIDFMTSGDT